MYEATGDSLGTNYSRESPDRENCQFSIMAITVIKGCKGFEQRWAEVKGRMMNIAGNQRPESLTKIRLSSYRRGALTKDTTQSF